MDDLDLATRLDRSIGPAPQTEPPLGELLTAGHRVVRRRRFAGALASVAAVLVVAGGAALMTGGGPDRASAPVADDPSASETPGVPSASASPAPVPESGYLDDGSLAEYGPDGVVIAVGATVVDRIANPLHVKRPARSVALAIEDADAKTYWMVLYDDEGGGASGMIPAKMADGTFADWATSQTGLVPQDTSGDGGGTFPGDPDPGLVEFTGSTDTLTLVAPGATLLDQRGGVDLGASFAGPGDLTAAALVREADGTLTYVLARQSADGEPQYIGLAASEVGEVGDPASLDALIRYARKQYAEGGGGLL